MRQKVVIATDTTTLGYWYDVSHLGFFPAFESDVPVEWRKSVNDFLGKHKIAASVLHRRQPIAQAYHDCGMLISHMPIDHVAGPIGSGRKIFFSAMEVRVQGASVGFALTDWDPATPMLTCGNIPLPRAQASDAANNGVLVGLDPELDYALCWRGIWIEMMFATTVSIVSLAVDIATMGAEKPAAALGEVVWDLFKKVTVDPIKSIFTDPLTAADTANYAGDFFNPGQDVIEENRDVIRHQRDQRRLRTRYRRDERREARRWQEL